jgi:hypothetical protein
VSDDKIRVINIFISLDIYHCNPRYLGGQPRQKAQDPISTNEACMVVHTYNPESQLCRKCKLEDGSQSLALEKSS